MHRIAAYGPILLVQCTATSVAIPLLFCDRSLQIIHQQIPASGQVSKEGMLIRLRIRKAGTDLGEGDVVDLSISDICVFVSAKGATELASLGSTGLSQLCILSLQLSHFILTL